MSETNSSTSLIGRKVTVGISGGIAAYKSPLLIRLLKKAGAEVRVIATQNALQFTTKWTLEILAETALESDLFPNATGSTHHIDTAQWADLFIVAPATANVIGKIASGISDDILTATLCAYEGPVMIAPAMNTNMYLNPITKRNLGLLRDVGYVIVEPDSGEMACHTFGVGRMAEPERIFHEIVMRLENVASKIIPTRASETEKPLAGLQVVVTAGPCREAIDPVRYISNHSSGKMGYALARAAFAAGADVTLISGPTALTIPEGVRFIAVVSTTEMLRATQEATKSADLLIMAAAPADYMPAQQSASKLKKGAGDTTIQLVPTPDILKEVAKNKSPQLTVIGFALETDNEITNAQKKLQEKNLDLIVVNSATAIGSGPDSDTNQVTLITPGGAPEVLPLMSKESLAEILVAKIATIHTSRERATT